MKILLAEDNKINSIVLRKILERSNHVVVCVENGQEALNAAKKEDFDLIFMDCQMPILNGFEATQEIRKFNKNIRIIAVTGFVHEKEECIKSGMNDYIVKPYNRESIEEKLRLLPE